ncbi:MAG: hypothetical protein ACI9LY_002939 [Arenicella sp.]|jgi:hypothetical protein
MTTNNNLDKYRPKVRLAEVLKFTTSHPGLAVFLVYATIAIAGFIYLVTFYSYFDLEITVYLEIGDILVAGIKDPMVMLMVLGAFSVALGVWGIAYIGAPISAWLDKKFDKGILRFIYYLVGVQSVRSFWWTALMLLTVYFFVFIGVHSRHKAELIIEEKQSLILVDSKATSGTEDDYSLLGTSINYVFLYNHQTKNTLILPLESINSLAPNRALKEAIEPVPSN